MQRADTRGLQLLGHQVHYGSIPGKIVCILTRLYCCAFEISLYSVRQGSGFIFRNTPKYIPLFHIVGPPPGIALALLRLQPHAIHSKLRYLTE